MPLNHPARRRGNSNPWLSAQSVEARGASARNSRSAHAAQKRCSSPNPSLQYLQPAASASCHVGCGEARRVRLLEGQEGETVAEDRRPRRLRDRPFPCCTRTRRRGQLRSRRRGADGARLAVVSSSPWLRSALSSPARTALRRSSRPRRRTAAGATAQTASANYCRFCDVCSAASSLRTPQLRPKPEPELRSSRRSKAHEYPSRPDARLAAPARRPRRCVPADAHRRARGPRLAGVGRGLGARSLPTRCAARNRRGALCRVCVAARANHGRGHARRLDLGSDRVRALARLRLRGAPTDTRSCSDVAARAAIGSRCSSTNRSTIRPDGLACVRCVT